MVAKIVNGKNVRSVLHYNENKIASAEAELLLAAGFPRSAEQLSFKNKLDWFEHYTRQNEHTKTNAMHVMLNFSRQDVLDNETLKAVATEYMERIGFSSQPYLLYRHYDTAHPHVHLLTVNIADGGQRIETHNIGKIQSEHARKEIEIKYGLVKAEDHQSEALQLPKGVTLDKVLYGKRETKAAISAVVREVVDSYKFTSLAELNAVLQQFNVRAYRGEEDSVMYHEGGLIYQVLNSESMPVGIPIKASSIFGKPILRNLEKKFAANEQARKPYGQRLKHLLDKALKDCRDMQQLQNNLQRQGIRVLFRENVQGNIYGVTFIDNATRVIYNGSDLGKSYGAKTFLDRLGASGLELALPRSQYYTDLRSSSLGNTFADHAHKQTLYPAGDQPVLAWLTDALLKVEDPNSNNDPFRRRKKRRQQIE